MTACPTKEELTKLLGHVESLLTLDVQAAANEPFEWALAAMELEAAMTKASKVLAQVFGERAKRPREENAEPPGTPVKKPRVMTKKEREEACEGCRNEWRQQLHHTCLDHDAAPRFALTPFWGLTLPPSRQLQFDMPWPDEEDLAVEETV